MLLLLFLIFNQNVINWRLSIVTSSIDTCICLTLSLASVLDPDWLSAFSFLHCIALFCFVLFVCLSTMMIRDDDRWWSSVMMWWDGGCYAFCSQNQMYHWFVVFFYIIISIIISISIIIIISHVSLKYYFYFFKFYILKKVWIRSLCVCVCPCLCEQGLTINHFESIEWIDNWLVNGYRSMVIFPVCNTTTMMIIKN